MASEARSRLIVALDYDRLGPALAMAQRLLKTVGMFKVGNQLFTAQGPRALDHLAELGCGIFLDLKFHDIPSTVAASVAAAISLPGVRLLNIHALGGSDMMRAAAKAAADTWIRGDGRPKVLAVTLLTSLDEAAIHEVGLRGLPQTRAVKLAKLAREAGLDGVITSPQECRAIRLVCGEDFTIVVLGIRPAGAERGDQRRFATPAEAIRAGADYLAVGRPVTQARDPVAAAEAIVSEMEQALPR